LNNHILTLIEFDRFYMKRDKYLYAEISSLLGLGDELSGRFEVCRRLGKKCDISEKIVPKVWSVSPKRWCVEHFRFVYAIYLQPERAG
jgi:hypothetical protein